MLIVFRRALVTLVADKVAGPNPDVFRFNVPSEFAVVPAIVRPPMAVPVFMFAVKVVAASVVGVMVVNPELALVSVIVKVPVAVETTVADVVFAARPAVPVMFIAFKLELVVEPRVIALTAVVAALLLKFSVVKPLSVAPVMV
jgi:hypothetical protein